MNDKIRALIFEVCNDWVSRGNLFTDDIQECFLNSTGDKGKYPFALDALAKMALAADQQPPQPEARQQAEEVERLRAELDALKKQKPARYEVEVKDEYPPEDWIITPLYASPIPPVPSVPDEVMRDAERYRLVRRGQHWSVIDGIGDDLRAEALDAAVDAMLSATPQPERGNADWPTPDPLHLRAICFAYEKGFAAGLNGRNTENVFAETGGQQAAFDLGLESGCKAADRGCGACGDACINRGSCRVEDESPKPEGE